MIKVIKASTKSPFKFPYFQQLNSTNLSAKDFVKSSNCAIVCEAPVDEVCCKWKGGVPKNNGKCGKNVKLDTFCQQSTEWNDDAQQELNMLNIPFFAFSEDMIDTHAKTTQKVYFNGLSPAVFLNSNENPVLQQFLEKILPISIINSQSAFGVITILPEFDIGTIFNCFTAGRIPAIQLCINKQLDKYKPIINNNTQYKFANFKYESPDLFKYIIALFFFDSLQGPNCMNVPLGIDEGNGNGCWGPWVMK